VGILPIEGFGGGLVTEKDFAQGVVKSRLRNRLKGAISLCTRPALLLILYLETEVTENEWV